MDVVRKYAPYLLFSHYEHHLPGEPEIFRKNARFRQSNYEGRRDRGWNRTLGCWESSNKHGPDYWGTDWQTILKLIRQETDHLRPGEPTWGGEVTRPRDERNLWRDEDSARGFILELREGLGRQSSGAEPGQQVPIFHDIDRFTVDGREYVALAYWFFYICNWYIFITHEGDWEHITFYFRGSDYDRGDPPRWIYFASHNKGLFLPLDHPSLSWEEQTHIHTYVLPKGHPSYPTVPKKNRHEYTIRWRTWDYEQDIPPIDNQLWKLYDGAWGEVGERTDFTGPLGPFFKRRRDKVYLSRKDKRIDQK